MRGSILHKETFQARDTDTSTYVDDMMLNEQTLQLDEGILGSAFRAFRDFMANPKTWKASAATGALAAGGIGANQALQLTNAMKDNLANLLDPNSWVGTAATLGIGATAAFAVYNLFKNWMAEKEETKRAEKLARITQR